MESWKRRLKISSDSSRTFCLTSSSASSRHFDAFMPSPRASEGARPRHELRRDPDLLGGVPERIARDVGGHPLHLVEDAAGLHDGHPLLGIPLALAHARLGGLLRDRLVGKDADPDLAAALEASREGHPGRLDLAV